jgi:hypothetical protein
MHGGLVCKIGKCAYNDTVLNALNVLLCSTVTAVLLTGHANHAIAIAVELGKGVISRFLVFNQFDSDPKRQIDAKR